MSKPIVAAGLPGVDVLTETDPNKFIFHSSYNTLKIIQTGIIAITIPHNTGTTDYLVAHLQQEVPFVLAFMREASLSEVIFQNNQSGDPISYLQFESINVDYINMIFRLANTHPANDIVANIKYYMFELPI